MRKNLVALATAAVLCTGAVGVGSALRAQAAERTTWSGVFTAAQAQRGAAAYAANCGACHGVQLGGTGEAPPLTGGEFLSNYSGLTVGDLFDRVRKTMPFNNPDSLASDTNADIIAHLLEFNGFPAGAEELAKRTENLATIKIVTEKPAGLASAPSPAPSPALPVALSAAVAPQTAAAAPPQAAPAQPPPALGASAPLITTGVNATNAQPNPYRRHADFFQMPAGRTMGSSSAVAVDSKGNVWVAERCGANSCADSQLDPILKFDATGKFVSGFGRNMFLFPHGFYIDREDNVWITDARVGNGRGGQVVKFSPSGQVLLTLGKAGVSTEGTDGFYEPNAVVVARDGTIFVADGHTPGKGAHRVMMFDLAGKFVGQWGTRGKEIGQIEVPHAIAIDSQDRILVGDRWNNRIQIFDRTGKSLATWTQFGRPSGMYLDKNDMLYVADSESRTPAVYGNNPGWKRGIRIGSVKNGNVTAFIPDLEPNPDGGATSGAEGIWADGNGVVYGAQVKERAVARYVKQ